MSTIITKELKLPVAGNYKVNVEKYESANDVVNDCKERKITDTSFQDKSIDTFSMGFEGVKTYDEALNLLRNGYQPTVEKLKTCLKATKTGVEKRMQFSNNIVGFAPVVPLALKNVPCSMVDMSMKPIKCKVLDVYYDMSVSCATSPETIIENGQKMLGAIVELEKRGYRFNLYGMQCYTDGRSADILCVKIKSSSKPMDLKRMSFPLTHPAFFRVIGFDWYSKMPLAKYRGGYGMPLMVSMKSKDRNEMMKEIFGDNAIYVSSKQIIDEDEEHIKEMFTNGSKKNNSKN